MNFCTEKQSKFSQINSERRVRTTVTKHICKPQAWGKRLLLSSPSLYFLSFFFLENVTYSPFKTKPNWAAAEVVLAHVLYSIQALKCMSRKQEMFFALLGGDLTSPLWLGDCPKHHVVCWDMHCSSTTVRKQSQAGRAGVRVQRECDVYFFLFFKHMHMQALFCFLFCRLWLGYFLEKRWMGSRGYRFPFPAFMSNKMCANTCRSNWWSRMKAGMRQRCRHLQEPKYC